MDSQAQHVVSLISASEQRNFRLLELPVELAESLSSGASHSLSFKSGAPSSSSLAFHPPEPAVLCTTSKTYQLRQVHSSNSIYIAQKTLLAATEVSAISLIGSSKTILETSTGAIDASNYLAKLPYVDLERNLDQTSSEVSHGKDLLCSKAVWLANAPFSHDEFMNIWVERVAFELNGISYQPTIPAQHRAWSVIFETLVAEGCDFENDELRIDRVWGLLENDGLPKQMIEAILTKVSNSNIGDESHRLIPKDLVTWVGSVVLGMLSPSGQQLESEDFLTAWKVLLPEKWTDIVNLDLLSDCLSQGPGSSKIGSRPEEPALLRATKLSTSAKEKKTGSRKWHERFRKTA